MTRVTCRLTAENRDQLRNPTLGNRVRANFTFFCVWQHLNKRIHVHDDDDDDDDTACVRSKYCTDFFSWLILQLIHYTSQIVRQLTRDKAAADTCPEPLIGDGRVCVGMATQCSVASLDNAPGCRSSGDCRRVCIIHTHAHTHSHLTALCPGLPGWAGTYQKGKTNMDFFLKQETVSGSGISWARCKSAPCSRQTTTPAPHHSVFTGRMPFLAPNQQRQSTEGSEIKWKWERKWCLHGHWKRSQQLTLQVMHTFDAGSV